MNKLLTAAAVVIAIVGFTPLPAKGQANSAPIIQSPNPVEGRYIVTLKPEVSKTAIAAKVAGKSKVLKVYSRVLNGFSMAANPEEAARLVNDPRVESVTEDSFVKKTDTQTIPAPPNTYWGLNRIDQRQAPPNEVAGKYRYNYTGSGVHAYVLDTGIRTSHKQFGGRASFDYTASDAGKPGVDCDGHGTHVAGTIGGSTYGVAKKVKLHAVKVLDCDGVGTWSGVIEGIEWITNNAKKPAVVNASLGGGYIAAVNKAVSNSIASGITWTVSAGNSTDDACLYSPAGTATAITVGSIGGTARYPINNQRSWFSNYGSCLDIFAPGSHILSSYNTSNTATKVLSGTSMASPHAAGVAALILQKSPKASPANVRSQMLAASTKDVVLEEPGDGSPNRLLYSRIP